MSKIYNGALELVGNTPLASSSPVIRKHKASIIAIGYETGIL